MTLEEFINKVTEEIKNYLPEEYADGEIHVFDQSLVGGCCKAMTITVPQHTLEHMVYLDPLYADFCNGKTFTEIMQIIAQIVLDIAPDFKLDAEPFLKWENAKDFVTSYLLNAIAPENKLFLAEHPHTLLPETNLAIAYTLDLSALTPYTRATLIVDNILLEEWKVDIETVQNTATINNPRIHPIEFLDIASILSEIADMPLKHNTFGDMVAVTNQQHFTGAISVLYPNVEETLKEYLGDFYLFPSSINEMIAFRRDAYSMEEMLRKIAKCNAAITPDKILDSVPYKLEDGVLKAITIGIKAS